MSRDEKGDIVEPSMGPADSQAVEDTSKIPPLSSELIHSSPYPGLRPFHVDESHIFFGRDRQVDELLEMLQGAHFLAVVGPSGSGKSSLVRAGMIAALEAGFMVREGSRWRVATMRPGSHPIARLAKALAQESVLNADEDILPFIEATLRRGPLGLLEVLEGQPLPERTNLLILVDQFEEIFRFREGGGDAEANEFVRLLLATANEAAESQVRVYVVITMRSDFLGDCALFMGLPEAINKSQFLTPRMTREERQETIEAPARVFQSEVAPGLVNEILNEMGPDPDQLPLMQHLMMRMWTSPPAGEEQGDDRGANLRLLTHEDYMAAGGLEGALSNHADKAYAHLDEEHRRIAEVLFRRLVKREPGGRDIRRPTAVEDIAAVAAVDSKEVCQVVEAFRHPRRSFLTPSAAEPLYPNTLIDISHESLIRQWKMLKGWVDDEARSAETYRELEKDALKKQRGEVGLWRDPELQLALDWRDRQQPTAEWAIRYGRHFEPAMQFLEESERARQEEKAERRHKILRRRAWVSVIGVTIIVSIIGGLIAGQKNANKTRDAARAVLATAGRVEIDPELAVWLALYAHEQDPSLAGPAIYQALWNHQQLRARHTLPPTPSAISDTSVNAVVFRSDSMLVVGSETNVIIWELAKAPGQRSIPRSFPVGATVLSLALEPESAGAIAVGRSDGRVTFLDAGSGISDTTIRMPDSASVLALAFSDDGEYLAAAGQCGTCSEQTIVLWRSSDNGQWLESGSLTGHTGPVFALDFAPGANTRTPGYKLASASGDSTVRIWTLPGSADEDTTATILVDSSKFFDSGSKRVVLQKTSRDFLRSVLFIHDTLLVTGDDQGAVNAWNPESGNSVRGWVPRPYYTDPTTLTNQRTRITGLAYHPAYGGQVAAVSDNGIGTVWAIRNSVPQFQLLGHQSAISSVAFSHDGESVATGSRDGTAKVWRTVARDPLASKELKISKELNYIHTHVRGVAFSPNSELLATAADDNTVRVWDVLADTLVFTLDPVVRWGWYDLWRDTTMLHGRWAAVAFSPDGKYLAAGSLEDKVAVVYQLDPKPRTLQDTVAQFRHSHWVWDVEFSPNYQNDGLIATASADSTVKIWRWRSPGDRDTVPLHILNHDGWVMAVAFSPNFETDRLIATASRDGTARVWTLSSDFPYPPTDSLILEGHLGDVWDVAFHPTRQEVVTVGGDRTVRKWNAITGEALNVWQAHDDMIWGVAFHPDGDRFATASFDGTVRFWDADGFSYAVPNFERRIERVAFSPDGLWLAASNRLVRASLDSLRQRAVGITTRQLNARECKLYLNKTSCPGFFELDKQRD